jgi:hypothetical protein
MRQKSGGASVTDERLRAKNQFAGISEKGGIARMGYWLEYWWMFPVALTICITV